MTVSDASLKAMIPWPGHDFTFPPFYTHHRISNTVFRASNDHGFGETQKSRLRRHRLLSPLDAAEGISLYAEGMEFFW